jgi:hypothetical protein
VDKSGFAVTLKRLLPAAQIKQVCAACKDEGVLGGSAVYQVVSQGPTAGLRVDGRRH